MHLRQLLVRRDPIAMRAIVIAVVLIGAALFKLTGWESSAREWSSAPVLATVAKWLGARTLVFATAILELGLALALLMSRTRKTALALAFVGFQLGLGWLLVAAMNGGSASKCGCLGVRKLSTESHVALLVGLSLLALSSGPAGSSPAVAAVAGGSSPR